MSAKLVVAAREEIRESQRKYPFWQRLRAALQNRSVQSLYGPDPKDKLIVSLKDGLEEGLQVIKGQDKAIVRLKSELAVSDNALEMMTAQAFEFRDRAQRYEGLIQNRLHAYESLGADPANDLIRETVIRELKHILLCLEP